MDTFDENADYLVLDDVPWDKVPSKKALFGAQKEWTITDKYRAKKIVKFGKPVIYLFNKDTSPWNFVPNMSDEGEWYKENVVHIKLTNKIY